MRIVAKEKYLVKRIPFFSLWRKWSYRISKFNSLWKSMAQSWIETLHSKLLHVNSFFSFSRETFVFQIILGIVTTLKWYSFAEFISHSKFISQPCCFVTTYCCIIVSWNLIGNETLYGKLTIHTICRLVFFPWSPWLEEKCELEFSLKS